MIEMNMAQQTAPEFSDIDLDHAVDEAICIERESIADVVSLLSEVARRKLHLRLGYSSMLDYATLRKGYGKGAAWRRVRVAHLANKRPEVIDLLRTADLSLATAVEVAPHLDDHPELLQQACGRSRGEVQELIAATIGSHAPRGERSERRVGTEDIRMTMVISVKTKGLLDEAMALSFHKHPDMNIDAVLHDALECYVASEKKRKFAVTDHPRQRTRDGQAERDSVSADAKREVYARDAGQCAYIGQDGVRCTSRVGVEIDHITPRAKHGGHQAENLRLACPLCRFRHNGHYADSRIMPTVAVSEPKTHGKLGLYAA
jgi:5-methylcytosine-specific restriction endonuclease McrA